MEKLFKGPWPLAKSQLESRGRLQQFSQCFAQCRPMAVVVLIDLSRKCPVGNFALVDIQVGNQDAPFACMLSQIVRSVDKAGGPVPRCSLSLPRGIEWHAMDVP